MKKEAFIILFFIFTSCQKDELEIAPTQNFL